MTAEPTATRLCLTPHLVHLEYANAVKYARSDRQHLLPLANTLTMIARTVLLLASLACAAAQQNGGESVAPMSRRCADASDWLTTFDGCPSDFVTGPAGQNAYTGSPCGGVFDSMNGA